MTQKQSPARCRALPTTLLWARVSQVFRDAKEFLKLLLRHKGPAGRPNDMCCSGEVLINPPPPTELFTLSMPDNEIRTGEACSGGRFEA